MMEDREKKSGEYAAKIFTLRPIFGGENIARSKIFTEIFNIGKGKFLTV